MNSTDEFPEVAVERLTKEVPNFIKAVHHSEASMVVTTLRAFHQDPILLYVSIWYATSHGKSISFAATS